MYEVLMPIFISIFGITVAEVTFWEPQYYPNPRLKAEECGLDRIGWVCDPNFALQSRENLKRINEAVERLRAETECGCSTSGSCTEIDPHGYTVAVAIVENMAVPEDVTKSEKTRFARKFAEKLREKYRLGQCDDDIIIFVSRGDRKVWTTVGGTTAQILTHRRIQEIFKVAQPHFSNDQYAEGLLTLINEYNGLLQKGTSGGGSFPVWASVVIVVGAFGIIGLVVFIIFKFGKSAPRRHSHHGGGGHYNEHDDHRDEPLVERRHEHNEETRRNSGGNDVGGGGDF